MRTRKKEIEVFSISLVDLISGALGVMSILFFAIIPEISAADLIDVISDANDAKVEPILDESFRIVSLHIFHKKINGIKTSFPEASTSNELTSDYFIDSEIVLFKTTIILDENFEEFNVNFVDEDLILKGSKVVFHSKGEIKHHNLELGEQAGFKINSDLTLDYY